MVMAFSHHPPFHLPLPHPPLPPDHLPQLGFPPPSPQPPPPPADREMRFPFVAPFIAGGLGVLGLRLPVGVWPLQVLYTGLGFGLCWLAVLLDGQREGYFSSLLLVVVIRACLLFPWRGRLLVAFFAYGSFLLMMLSAIQRIHRPGIDLDRLTNSTQASNAFSAFSQHVVTTLFLNSALLFGLILVFVLLLVGSLLAERQSRQDLAIANRQLRQYALLIEDQTILQERNRIAREIHDSLGHSLTAQSIQLEYVAMLLSEDVKRAGRHLQTARQLGKEALQNVRHSVSSLRSHPLQGRSLTTALAKLLQEFEQTTGIQTNPSIHLPIGTSEEVATALYRITQEALTNIAKHSGATQIYLHLAESKMEISLRIEDDGRGFEPVVNTTGFGLQGMRERAEALGGSFCLVSQPEQGCQIQVSIPLSGRTLEFTRKLNTETGETETRRNSDIA